MSGAPPPGINAAALSDPLERPESGVEYPHRRPGPHLSRGLEPPITRCVRQIGEPLPRQYVGRKRRYHAGYAFFQDWPVGTPSVQLQLFGVFRALCLIAQPVPRQSLILLPE